MVFKLCIFQTYSEHWEVIIFEDIFGFCITETSLATISNFKFLFFWYVNDANLVYKLLIPL